MHGIGQFRRRGPAPPNRFLFNSSIAPDLIFSDQTAMPRPPFEVAAVAPCSGDL